MYAITIINRLKLFTENPNKAQLKNIVFINDICNNFCRFVLKY